MWNRQPCPDPARASHSTLADGALVGPPRMRTGPCPRRVVRYRLSHREGVELVGAEHHAGRLPKSGAIEGATERPFVRAAEGRGRGWVGAHIVAVTASGCALPRMEAGGHRRDPLHPAVLRQQGVQRPTDCLRGPFLRHREAHAQAQGVHPGIGPARAVGHHPSAGQSLQHPLELRLDRPRLRLPLPPREPAAIIVQQCQIGPAHETRNIAGREGVT